MTDQDLLAKFNEESSDSSISGDEPCSPESLPPPPHEEEAKKPQSFRPYTVDPRNLVSVAPKSTCPSPSKTLCKFASLARLDTPIRVKSPIVAAATKIERKSTLTGGVANEERWRLAPEYKDFAGEFDRRFAGGDREASLVAQNMEGRRKGLGEFLEELERTDVEAVDMILFRNRLAREIGDVQNGLKEAHSNILMLMKERTSMKDQFCIQQVKLGKLSGVVKALREDIAMYALIRSIFNRRDTAYDRLATSHRETKEEADRLRQELEKFKVASPPQSRLIEMHRGTNRRKRAAQTRTGGTAQRQHTVPAAVRAVQAIGRPSLAGEEEA